MRFAFLLLAVAALLPAQAINPDTEKIDPAVLRKVEPEYTKQALDAKVHGVVLLNLVVGIDGKASDIRVIRGLSNGLDENAVECVKKWRFRPGLRFGKPIPTHATVEINFRLPEQPSQWAKLR